MNEEQIAEGLARVRRAAKLAPEPEPNTLLLLDYDRETDIPGWALYPGHSALESDRIDRWGEVLAKRLARAGYELDGFGLERSTNGWHGTVYITPPTSSRIETVALQLVCGSDPLRESCNVQRARVCDSGTVSDFWLERWNVLYAPNPSRREGDL